MVISHTPKPTVWVFSVYGSLFQRGGGDLLINHHFKAIFRILYSCAKLVLLWEKSAIQSPQADEH
uniref:Uncharacterized protein n=1 Tax=Arsenophonus nasoniae TaxID=638 RepID=D2U1C6_9GAMM|nr:hypothetical protein ARN_23430 [Arsenophonus nasoniae]